MSFSSVGAESICSSISGRTVTENSSLDDFVAFIDDELYHPVPRRNIDVEQLLQDNATQERNISPT